MREECPLSESDRWLAEELIQQLEFLNNKIAGALARIEKATRDAPLVAKLLSLFGVGLITAVTVRAEIGRFDRFDTGKQLSRFCGVTPQECFKW